MKTCDKYITDNVADDFHNPHFLMQIWPSELLMQVVNGEVDLDHVAQEILMSDRTKDGEL